MTEKLPNWNPEQAGAEEGQRERGGGFLSGTTARRPAGWKPGKKTPPPYQEMRRVGARKSNHSQALDRKLARALGKVDDDG